MCVFAGPIEHVSNTRIFAAPGPDGRQRLVYAMELEIAREVAMILPLPVARDAGKDALRFVDLSAYPEFFDDLHALFLSFEAGSAEVGEDGALSCDFETLPVEIVGDFEASYVPSHDDWERLDPRFRLDPALWELLPDYHDHGFAVFQLAPAARGGSQRIHPMAFEFASRRPDEIFFPTVHIHDGAVHPTARFDHDLYCQLPEDHPLARSFVAEEIDGIPLLSTEKSHDWLRATCSAADGMDVPRTAGLVDAAAPILLRQIAGEHPNRDVIVPAEGF